MNVEIGRQNIIKKFCFGNNEAAQFHFWEYINRNQTFISGYVHCTLSVQLLNEFSGLYICNNLRQAIVYKQR
jgi:hypothetical protein